jgi:hypothetical protein
MYRCSKETQGPCFRVNIFSFEILGFLEILIFCHFFELDILTIHVRFNLILDTNNYSIKAKMNLECMLYTSKSYPNVQFLLTKEAILRLDSKVGPEKRVSNMLFVVGMGNDPEELGKLREEIDSWIVKVLTFQNDLPHEIDNKGSDEPIETFLKNIF